MSRRLRLVISSILVLALHAQADTASDTQQWTTLRVNHSIGERWAASLQSEVRFDNDISEYRRTMLLPALHYTFSPGLIAGLGYTYWNKHDAADEHRLVQDLAFAQHLGKLVLGPFVRREDKESSAG